MTTTLSNAAVRVAVDRQGNLASLQNLATGCEYLTRPGLDFWRIIYRGDDDPESVIVPAQQPPPEISATGAVIRCHYPWLVTAAGTRIEASFSYEIELRGEEIMLRSELEHRGGPEIVELWFPLVGGLGNLGDDPGATFLLYPESAGRRIVDPVRHVADRNAQPTRGVRCDFLRDLYPGRASMSWLGLYGARGSLYVGSHDTSLQTTAVQALLNLGANPAGDSLSLGFIKYPFLQPGRRWTSAPFVLAVHHGSWHADSRRYRAFADTWQNHRRAKPDWVRDVPAMHDIIMLHQHGRVNFRYDEIPVIAAAARAAGIDVVKLTGWSHGGHDNQYPDFLPSERLGGEAALAARIGEAQAAGSRVVIYLHFVQMSPNSAFYRQHGEFCAMKGPEGNPFIDVFTWPSHGSIRLLNERCQLINACVATQPWQEHVLDCCRRGLAWGADSLFVDQTAGGPSSFLCFDARHGHSSPAFACGPGKTALSAKARDLAKARNPDVALGAEYIADVILQYYDYTVPFGMGFFHGGQHFGELYRFTYPEDILFTQYMAREDYEQLHYAFVMGYRFFLAPRQQCDLVTALDPAFVARLGALIALRRRHAAVLLRGTFLDTQPLAVGNPALCVRAYAFGPQRAVAAWNPTAVPQPLEVRWGESPPAVADTPDGPLGLGLGAGVLPPGQVAVLGFD